MAQNEQSPTSQQLTAFEAALDQLAGLGRLPKGLAVDPHPIAIFNLGLRQCADSQDLWRAATMECWRFFASGGNPIVTVSGDVSISTPARVTGISYGKQVIRLWKNALGLAAYNTPRGQMSLLQIPGMSLEAFFLDSMQLDGASARGAIVPYRSFFPDLFSPKERLAPEAFFVRVRQKAIEILNYIDPAASRKEAAELQERPSAEGPTAS